MDSKNGIPAAALVSASALSLVSAWGRRPARQLPPFFVAHGCLLLRACPAKERCVWHSSLNTRSVYRGGVVHARSSPAVCLCPSWQALKTKCNHVPFFKEAVGQAYPKAAGWLPVHGCYPSTQHARPKAGCNKVDGVRILERRVGSRNAIERRYGRCPLGASGAAAVKKERRDDPLPSKKTSEKNSETRRGGTETGQKFAKHAIMPTPRHRT